MIPPLLQLASIGSDALILASSGALLLASQLLYMDITNPRLPPPPDNKSGHDFVPEGLVVSYYHGNDDDAENGRSKSKSNRCRRSRKSSRRRKSGKSTGASEFRLVFVGDSTIEGVGIQHHAETMGGQTALEFSKLVLWQIGSHRSRYTGRNGTTSRTTS
jgi:hypothetical protein